MEPMNLIALFTGASLLILAAVLEVSGLFRFTRYVRGLLKRRPSTGSS